MKKEHSLEHYITPLEKINDRIVPELTSNNAYIVKMIYFI